jgi:hypothetical protein
MDASSHKFSVTVGGIVLGILLPHQVILQIAHHAHRLADGPRRALKKGRGKKRERMKPRVNFNFCPPSFLSPFHFYHHLLYLLLVLSL